MRVSIVVCTFNRAAGLRETLNSLRQQRFEDFEVIVVNGPSTDETESVIAEFDGLIKVERNPEANLAVSRNLGIRAAAGDVVAFIDDDALPEFCWLDQVVGAFVDPEVGGVGGIVLDHTGMALQYRYSAANRFGEATWSDDAPFDDFSVPGSFTFPYLQGTNALFRRDVLGEVGLFDETYDYYLDETDICLRVVDAGYVLRQLDDAPVHHKYLPSAVRNHERVITNWFPVVKNHVYFGYRHALHDATELEVIDRARRFIDHIVEDTRRHEQAGTLPPGHTQRALESCGPALATGIELGRRRHPIRLPPERLERADFLRFPTLDTSRRRNIVLVSSGYTPTLTGGISRFVSDVAPELARRGHDVRVLTGSSEESTVDLEDGVWVHRLAPAAVPGRIFDGPAHVDGFATAAADELVRLGRWWSADVAYGSLWDVELLGIARDDTAPVVPMLATPVAEVAVHEGWDRPDAGNFEMIRGLIALEHELMGRARLVHAISDAIVETVEALYPGALDPSTTAVAHIGRADDDLPPTSNVPTSPPMVLFVGRLEARKGIDVFLDAAELVLANHDHVAFVVAGDDGRPSPTGTTYPDEWRTRQLEGGDRLSFVGPVGDGELAELLRQSTVVVMPSRYESFGLVVVEAMMHGRAVVASAVGGIRELVEEGVTGHLVPVGDPRHLAGVLTDLLADPERAAAMGRAGRTRYEQHFSTDRAAERLETVLEAAIGADPHEVTP